MARAANFLTEKRIRALKKGDAATADGKVTGLMYIATNNGGRWFLRYVSPASNKRRDAGLGVYPDVTITEAREKALAMRRQIDKGIDPIDERSRARAAAIVASAEMTFAKAAQTKHEELKPSWKNEKHQKQWISTLEVHSFPKLGHKKIDEITPADCAEVLRPIWLTTPETALRVRQRMHTVMDWALAHGHVTANPVSVVRHLLPKQKASTEHHPAMPWCKVPAFIRQHLTPLQHASTARAALIFLILTASRSGEVRGARWREISPDFQVWTIPAERMKMDRPHRVPLSDQAIALLKFIKQKNLDNSLIFPSNREKNAEKTSLSDMALTSILRNVNAPSDSDRVATAHGFRSSFRDWASECNYSRDLAERSLAHAVKDETEAAYHRTDLFMQRRPMMQAWADLLIPKEINASTSIKTQPTA